MKHRFISLFLAAIISLSPAAVMAEDTGGGSGSGPDVPASGSEITGPADPAPGDNTPPANPDSGDNTTPANPDPGDTTAPATPDSGDKAPAATTTVVKKHKRSFPSRARRSRVNVSIGKRFDPRLIAHEKSPGYDTIQGVAYNKNYGYFVLYNRDKEKVKIVKIDMRTKKLVKKSKAYSYCTHGNTLTYNTKTGRLVMPIGKHEARKVAIISSKTLKILRTKSLPIDSRCLGKRYQGIAGIAYNSARNVYVVKPSGSINKLVILTAGFKRKKVVTIKGNVTDLTNQGIFSENKYTYDIKSFSGSKKYNLIIVRNIDTGKVVKNIKVSCGIGSRKYELENIYVDRKSNYVYAAFYKAYVKKSGDLHRENYLYKITNM